MINGQSIAGELPQKDELHVWNIALDCSADLTRLTTILSAEEKDRAMRLRVAHRRAAFVYYRAQVRNILAEYLGCPADEVPIVATANGKPALAPPCALAFNLSHRADLALLAVSSNGSVGIDLECLDSQADYDALARQALSARELDLYESLSLHDRPAAMLRAWTRKEAFLKATGVALTRLLASVEVTFLEGERPRLMATGDARELSEEWSLQAWSPRPGWFAALALRQKSAGVRIRRFDATSLSAIEMPVDRTVLPHRLSISK